MRLFAILVGGLIVCVCVAEARAIVIHPTPQGDGNSLRARYGFTDTWHDYAFEDAADPTRAAHEYDGGSAWGETRNAFIQISLATISDPDIAQATLNLYITNYAGNGSSLRHRTDASTATGLASQALAGDVTVMDLTPANIGSTGWLSIDVTDYIQQDIDSGHAWAVFSLPSKSYSLLAFSSADGSIDDAPYLNVQLVPEPGSIMLLLGGLWLIGFRPRHH